MKSCLSFATFLFVKAEWLRVLNTFCSDVGYYVCYLLFSVTQVRIGYTVF